MTHLEPPAPTATPAGGIRWRTAAVHDADGIHAVAVAAGAVDHPYFTVPREEVIEDLETIAAGGGGGIVGIDRSGVILAFGMVVPFSLDSAPLTGLMIGAVTPDARGIGLGREIVSWQRQYGFDLLASVDPSLPRRLMSYVDADAVAARAVLRQGGFDVAREYLHLRRSSAAVPDVALPDGCRILPFTEDRSETVRTLRNAAFDGQWGAHDLDASAWASFTSRAVFDSALSRVVLDERDDVVGYTLVEVDPAARDAAGRSSSYLASLGVRASHRRRGIGAALIADLVRLTRERGLDEVALDVDSASDSRATALYARLGFDVSRRRYSYIDEQPPRGPGV